MLGLVVNIAKNEVIDLSKNSNVTSAQIGLSWEANSTPSRPFDLDASVLLLDAKKRILKLRMEELRNRVSPHFIFNVLNYEIYNWT